MTAPNKKRRRAKPMYQKGDSRCNPSKVTKMTIWDLSEEERKRHNL
jgi:hypothetical protein